MSNFAKSLPLLFISALLSLSAQASIIVTASASGQLHSSVAGVTEVNFNDGTCTGYASCSNLTVVQGSVAGVYATPYTDTTKYSTVAKYKTSIFNLGEQADYFGLFWGSIDNYNTISFFSGGQLVQSYTGAPVSTLKQDGGRTSWASNRYINFNFVGSSFDTVKLYSSNNAFETDNHAFRLVPEPASIGLMGLALFGVLAARRLKHA